MKKNAPLARIGIIAAMITAASSITFAQAVPLTPWFTNGNVVSNPADILGSVNAADLVVVTSNTERLRVTAAGDITTSNISNLFLDVSGTINLNSTIGGGVNLMAGGLPLTITSGQFDLSATTGPMFLRTSSGPIDISSSGGGINLSSNGSPISLNSSGNTITFSGSGGHTEMALSGALLTVDVNTDITGDVDISGNVDITGDLTLNGDFTHLGDLALTGDITLNGNGTYSGSWTSVSDARFKTNVTRLENALGKVMSLRGVGYDWRRAEFPTRNFAAGRQIGFIAQEVEAVVPEVVVTNSDGYKSVAYQNITALLTEAIREQQAQIQAQDARIRELQERIARLEAAAGMR